MVQTRKKGERSKPSEEDSTSQVSGIEEMLRTFDIEEYRINLYKAALTCLVEKEKWIDYLEEEINYLRKLNGSSP